MISLSELLPQAEPMILLTGYEDSASDDAVTAFVDVTAESPFYDVELEGVPTCVTLEYMSQTMALLVGLTRRKKGLAPQVGFVLGSRKLETFIPHFRKGCRYVVRAVCTYEDESFGSFDCEILSPDGSCAARATMTAFQPGGDLTPERLEDYA